MALVRTAAQRGHQYDLALLDMKLPGIDGLELAGHIKADPSMSSVTLVMLTGEPLADMPGRWMTDSSVTVDPRSSRTERQDATRRQQRV